MILLRQKYFSKKEEKKKNKDALVYGVAGGATALGTGAALGAVKVGEKLSRKYGRQASDILNEYYKKGAGKFERAEEYKRALEKQKPWVPGVRIEIPSLNIKTTKRPPHGKNIRRLRGAGIGLAAAGALAAGGYALSKKKGKKDDNN